MGSGWESPYNVGMPTHRSHVGSSVNVREVALNRVLRLGGLAGLAVLAGILAGCSVFRQATPTPQPTTVVQITADQAAQAMQGDNFYATYGRNTLLIQGTVAVVDQQPHHLIVTLATGWQTQVLCDLGSQTAAIKPGDTLTLRVPDPENDVLRQDGALFIKNCALA